MEDDFLKNLIGGCRMRASVGKVTDITDCGYTAPVQEDSAVSSVSVPSMMELMIAAHREAKNEKDLVSSEEVKKTNKTFGEGFKKGFFRSGGGSCTKPHHHVRADKRKTETELYLSWMQMKPHAGVGDVNLSREHKSGFADSNEDPEIVTLIGGKNHEVPDLLGETATSMIADVRKAMSDDEPPILKQLKQGGECDLYSIY